MNIEKVKVFAIAVGVVLAGLCYSCGRAGDWSRLPEEGGGEALQESGSETEPGGALDGQESTRASVPPAASEKLCYVHICGEVARPGVYEMEEGSRVFQAVELAGGFTERAASEYLNMAGRIQDGMKLVVPEAGALADADLYGREASVQAGSGSGESGKVNLNTADKEELMTLKGIGESKAEDILRYREEQGPFQRTEDIMNISGIKDAAFQKIKNDITV